MSGAAVADDDEISVQVLGLTKSYGGAPVLDDVTLKVRRGEFVILLGASGSGKTTLLMSIAGFVRPERGRIMIGDRDVTEERPGKRDLGVVFQSYALFPHLSVFDNLAYALRIRKRPRREIAERVERAAAIVQLQGLMSRSVHQLSGGQRQRVALSRAIVFEPKVLLMDEPMSALDRSLRRELQVELRRVQRTLGTTTLLVTHDQEEAAFLGDRIAVLHAGKVLQFDTPEAVYRRPVDAYVASFFGDLVAVPAAIVREEGAGRPRRAVLRCRPESVRPFGAAPSGRAGFSFNARIRERIFMRDNVELGLELEDGSVISIRALIAGDEAAPGECRRYFVAAEDVLDV